MAPRSTNRVPIPVGPSTKGSTPAERSLAKRIDSVERATGLVESSGQDDPIILTGGGDTIVNNYTTVTGGGGGYTTNVIVGGTGVVNNPTMPTTLGVVYDRAYGSSLVSQLTLDGNALEGVYSDNGAQFRPVNNLSMIYSTGTTFTTNKLLDIGDWPSTDYFYPTSYVTGTGTSGGNTSGRANALFQLPSGEVGYVQGHSSNGNVTFSISTGPNSIASFAHGNLGTISGSTTYRVKPLGSDSSGNIYLMVLVSSHWTVIVKIDTASMYAAYISAGISQSPSNFKTSTTSGHDNSGAFLFYTYDYSIVEQWAGSLTGRDYAHMINAQTKSVVRVHLATGAATVMINMQANMPNGTPETCQHIASPEWGNSTTDQYLGWWWFGTEYRLVKFGSWGYADITAIGTGPTVNDNLHCSIVPQSATATMFFGGAPTHASWYDANLGGVQYVDLSTII